MRTNKNKMILPHGTHTGEGKSPRILISIPHDMRAEIWALAEKMGISDAEAARRLIDIGLKARKLALTSPKQ